MDNYSFSRAWSSLALACFYFLDFFCLLNLIDLIDFVYLILVDHHFLPRKKLIYQATVSSEGVPDENYIGLTSGTFKKRFENYIGLTSGTLKKRFDGHNSNFRNKEVKGTTLSKYIWKLKEDGKNFEINWKIFCNAKPFSPVNEQCALCTTEKFYIIFKP